MRHHILFHRDSDGRFAGYAAQRHLRNMHQSEIFEHGVQYGEPVPLVMEELTGEDAVYILDFSYPPKVLLALSERVGKLVVLDHHKTAEDALKGFQPHPNCDADILFDKSKSGALLAWEYFFPGEEVPLICELVNDRDLWKWEFGDESRAAEAYLNTENVGMDWKEWHRLATQPQHLEAAILKGHTYMAYEKSVVKRFTSSERNYSIIPVIFQGAEYKCCFYEGMNILHSEIAEGFYGSLDIDFTMEYRRKGEDVMVFSLRAPSIDVGAIAQAMGGGGHKAAAGFQATMIDGLDIVRAFYKAIGQKKFGSKIKFCEARRHFETHTEYVPEPIPMHKLVDVRNSF